AFLPAVTLGMMGIFKGRTIGLELACIVMIFTGQAWNMTFSFYGSIRAIPTELIEVARVHRFSWWRRFKTLELPASAIGLVWNSMMSMAGGWFFLMTVEAFKLEGKNFQLPGIGSYMNYVYDIDNERGGTNWTGVLWAIVAMVLVIVLTDQLLWRPLVAWSQKFKIEETEAAEAPRSWILSFLSRSSALRRLDQRNRTTPAPGAVAVALAKPAPPPLPSRVSDERARQVLAALGWTTGFAATVGSFYGAYRLWLLLATVTGAQWMDIGGGLALTSLRTVAALALGALWTIPVGVAIGLSPKLARRAQPIVQVLASFPAPMLFPLVTGHVLDPLGIPFSWGSLFLTLFGAQWYVLFNVIAGAMTIPHDLREATDVYHVVGFSRWRTLLLPGIFPHLLTGLITAAGGAWNAAIVTEYQGKSHTAFGLGSLIAKATDAPGGTDYPMLAASVLALTLTLVLLNRFVWKRLYKFADERFALNR
ncbi:ABC transporter permease subunit, partial [bacterium]|nr:ABC transporter permease subunit [bacterium]